MVPFSEPNHKRYTSHMHLCVFVCDVKLCIRSRYINSSMDGYMGKCILYFTFIMYNVYA